MRRCFIIYVILISHAVALSRLKWKHSVPHFLTEEEVKELKSLHHDGAKVAEDLEIKETTKRNGEQEYTQLSLKTDSKELQVDLTPVDRVITPYTRLTVIDGDNEYETEVDKSLRNSFFHGTVQGTSGGRASVMKGSNGWRGVILTNQEALVINRIQDGDEHYLIKLLSDEESEGPDLFQAEKEGEAGEERKLEKKDEKENDKKSSSSEPHLTLEVCVYMDQALYESIKTKFSDSDVVQNMQQFALLTICTVSLFYEEANMDDPIHVVASKLTIIKKTPKGLNVNQQVDLYQKAFCEWEATKNPRGLQGDIALMLTGFDLHGNSKKDTGVTGVAPYSGACKQYLHTSCVLAEGREFAAAEVAAHEIGHNHGMMHDGQENDCPKTGFIMGSTLTPGSTSFSSCSIDYLRKYLTELDEFNNNCLREEVHKKRLEFHDKLLPGERLHADEQCYYALGSSFHDYVKDEKFCSRLSCASWMYLLYPSGSPPLPGTNCGEGKICWGAKCVEKDDAHKEADKDKVKNKPAAEALSLDELCVKYGTNKEYNKGVQYGQSVGLSADNMRKFCEGGLVCLKPDTNHAYEYYDYPVPPGTPCDEGKTCWHFRCESSSNQKVPEEGDLKEVITGDGEEEEKEEEKAPISEETRDKIASFCKSAASKDAVPKPIDDCTIVKCEDKTSIFQLPAYLINTCPDGQICRGSDGTCIEDTGETLKGELTEEQRKKTKDMCKKEVGEKAEPLCVRSALLISERARQYCDFGFCDLVACITFKGDGHYILNAFTTPKGTCEEKV